MNPKIQEIKDAVVSVYSEYEKKLKRAKSHAENDYCFAGEVSGADIDLSESGGETTITVAVGDHSFWNQTRVFTAEQKTKLDLSVLSKKLTDAELLPALEQHFKSCAEREAFGGLYEPEVTICFAVGSEKTGLHYKREIRFASPEKQKAQIEKLRSFWMTDAYKSCNPRRAAASMKQAYNYLIYELFGELGVAGLKERLSTLMAIHKKAIAEVKESPGQVKGDRNTQTRCYMRFAQQLGVISRDYWDYSDEDPLPKDFDKIDFDEQEPPVLEEDTMALLCYMAIDMIRYGKGHHADKGVEILKALKKQKYAPAKQYLELGTGAIEKGDAVFKNELVECSCNDVFNTITLRIKEENEQTYGFLLDYVLNLMTTEFPKSYEIRLNSKLKPYIPVKSLNKTATQKFWVNCVSYEALRPRVVEYIRGMMKDTWFYSDADTENGVATGAYAMLALALESEEYAALFAEYLDTNKKYDHNIYGDDAIALYLSKWGISPKNADVAIQCVVWHENLSPKKIDFSGFKDEAVLKAVNETGELHPRTLERIVALVWGSPKNLKKEIEAAKTGQKTQMERLLKKAEEQG